MKLRVRLRTALAAVAVVVLLSGPACGGLSKVDGGIEFTHHDPNAGSVHLAGAFNNWSSTENPLTMDDGGTWRVVVALAPGSYEYKFVVNGSEWIADPENPKLVGEYGNSEIVIGEDGEPRVGAAGPSISNTSLSARVNVNGWYRATYDTRSDLPDDPRWRLDRPAHEVFLSVNPTVTPQVTGSATLRLNTGAGDIKELSADLYSGHITLEGAPFDVTGFYNEELIQFDNPLETVGHINLSGTITEEHLAYGRGSQGARLTLDAWYADIEVVYANAYDWGIYNDPGTYDNTDTDLLAARVKHAVGPVTLGTTYTSWKNGWWIDYGGTNQNDRLDDFIGATGSQSTWFELATSDQYLGFDIDWPFAAPTLSVEAEYSLFAHRSRWDMGNKEKVEGDDFGNGAIEIPVGEVDGRLTRVRLTGAMPPLLTAALSIEGRSLDSMGSGDEYVSFDTPLWAGAAIDSYNQVRYDGSPLVVNVFGPLPERSDWLYEFDGAAGFGIFSLKLEYDRSSYKWDFADHHPVHGGLKWDGRESRFALGLKADIFEDRTWVAIDTEFMMYDFGKALTTGLGNEIIDSSEIIISGRYGFNDVWGILADLRTVKYNESFFAPYIALVVSPRTNIEFRLGYGVDPMSYTDTPVEGRPNGRERWRSDYMWTHGGASLVDAEEALADARVIGLMGVISF